MTRINLGNLTDIQLDWAVAKCEGYTFKTEDGLTKMYKGDSPKHYWLPECRYDAGYWAPSLHWAQGGPIIEREEIGLEAAWSQWTAKKWESITESYLVVEGRTPLTAAMQCYVAAKLGSEIEIPEELL